MSTLTMVGILMPTAHVQGMCSSSQVAPQCGGNSTNLPLLYLHGPDLQHPPNPLDVLYHVRNQFPTAKTCPPDQQQCRIHLTYQKHQDQNSQVKYIDIHHHYIHECVKDGNIAIKYIPSVDNLADLLMKSLRCVAHHKFCTLFHLCNK